MAFPEASEVKTFPAPGDPPEILIVPLTSKVLDGEFVPIPTCVDDPSAVATVADVTAPPPPKAAQLVPLQNSMLPVLYRKVPA